MKEKFVRFPIKGGIWVTARKDLKGEKEKHDLCQDCKKYKPGQDDNCPIAKAIAKFEHEESMKVPVLECNKCILKNEVNRSKFECYEHHGILVMVKSEFKGTHRDICLCHECSRFKPGQDDNCPKAERLYKLCCKYGLVTPVFECPVFRNEYN